MRYRSRRGRMTPREMIDKRCAEFAEMRDGWDSYSARAITPEAISSARAIALALLAGRMKVWIFPTLDGGVQVETNHRVDHDIDIKIGPDGRVVDEEQTR